MTSTSVANTAFVNSMADITLLKLRGEIVIFLISNCDGRQGDHAGSKRPVKTQQKNPPC